MVLESAGLPGRGKGVLSGFENGRGPFPPEINEALGYGHFSDTWEMKTDG